MQETSAQPVTMQETSAQPVTIISTNLKHQSSSIFNVKPVQRHVYEGSCSSNGSFTHSIQWIAVREIRGLYQRCITDRLTGAWLSYKEKPTLGVIYDTWQNMCNLYILNWRFQPHISSNVDNYKYTVSVQNVYQLPVIWVLLHIWRGTTNTSISLRVKVEKQLCNFKKMTKNIIQSSLVVLNLSGIW